MDEARVEISLYGAELLRWQIGARDLLWSPQANFWDRTAPILFPVCGWTRLGQVRVAGKVYPLGLHGFASSASFELLEQGAGFVRLRLCDNAATRALYPFSFALDLTYRLGSDWLEVEALVSNRGAGPMPYAFGLHPGFRWLGAAEDCRLIFDEAERSEVPVIAPGGLFSQEMRQIPLAGLVLPLSSAVFAREALCFLGARSRGLSFEGPQGRLRVEGQGFPNWVIWSKPDAPFICLESWSGYGDPVDFEGDLFEKPGMTVLAPGENGAHQARYMFTA
jgi:galactose mutarotase-like enzyme